MSSPFSFMGEERSDFSEISRYGMRLAISAVLHPIDYARVLMQLGYEPIRPRPDTTFFGKPILLLPNVFKYICHIKKVDGFCGCYRGLAPKIIGSVVSMGISEIVADQAGLGKTAESEKYDSKLTHEELYDQFKRSLLRNAVLSVVGIVASQPFHVISLRTMAQFIGREMLYHSIYSSVIEIYKTDGVLGFFAGIWPKLIFDLTCLILTSSTCYMINKHIIKDQIGREYNARFVQFVFYTNLYPLNVVSTCMSVAGSRLVAGQPPAMPVYRSWLHCWKYLHVRDELSRGSTLFWRSASSMKLPYAALEDSPMPIVSNSD